MPEAKQPIIIKRVKKVVGGHHGGAWKVAFADFMTAMMAFFLVMWLLATMVPAKKRVLVANYFKFKPIVFPGSSGVFEENVVPHKSFAVSNPKPDQRELFALNPDDLREKLLRQIGAALSRFKDNVSVVMTEQGIRIEISDTPALRLFAPGDDVLIPDMKEILVGLSAPLGEVNNKIIIESHAESCAADAWATTSARALRVRAFLAESGIGSDRLVKVSGCGNSRALSAQDPQDVSNNKVSLLVLFSPVP